MRLKSDTNKNQQFEYIRAIAAVAVITIHTVNSGLIYRGDEFSENVIVFFEGIKNLLYWAVPCFAMLTGQLLCNANKELPIKKIYGKYFLRIATVLLIFGSGFSWLEIIFDTKRISFHQIPEAVFCVLGNNTWAHLWYLYALLGVYILLPLWRWFSRKVSDKMFFLLILLMTSIQFVTGNKYFALNTYVLIGAYMQRNACMPDKKQLIRSMLFSSFVIVLCSGLGVTTLLGYTSPLVVMQSFAIYCLLNNIAFTNERVCTMLKKAARVSFGIYLVHMFWVNMVYKVFKLHLMSSFTAIFVIAVIIFAIFVLSYFIAVILKKLPIIRTLV